MRNFDIRYFASVRLIFSCKMQIYDKLLIKNHKNGVNVAQSFLGAKFLLIKVYKKSETHGRAPAELVSGIKLIN